MKIQLTKTKTVEWTPPWQKPRSGADVTDVVGVELGGGDKKGCPAVRLQRRKDGIALVQAGWVPPPDKPLPRRWEDLKNQAKWTLPLPFRAARAALAVHSPDAFIRQQAAETFAAAKHVEGKPVAKDGMRSVFRRMADEQFVLQAGLPEWQTLWLSRLLPEGRRPTAWSVQTAPAALLAALARQPGFCATGDDACLFVTPETLYFAAFRKGIPLLFRECPGAAGAAVGVVAMREAVKSRLGIDEQMLDAVFATDGIIDVRPALEPLLKPVLAQIELSIDYLRSRLSSNVSRVFMMGDDAACACLKRLAGDAFPASFVSPDTFDGLQLPAKRAGWKTACCEGPDQRRFLVALGAALAAMEGET